MPEGYTKEDLEQAQMFGEIKQQITDLASVGKDTQTDVKEIKNTLTNFVTHNQLDKKLLDYVESKEFQPVKDAFTAGLKYLAGIFILLVISVVALLAIVLGKDLPLV